MKYLLGSALILAQKIYKSIKKHICKLVTRPQSEARLTEESAGPGSIPGPLKYSVKIDMKSFYGHPPPLIYKLLA